MRIASMVESAIDSSWSTMVPSMSRKAIRDEGENSGDQSFRTTRGGAETAASDRIRSALGRPPHRLTAAPTTRERVAPAYRRDPSIPRGGPPRSRRDPLEKKVTPATKPGAVGTGVTLSSAPGPHQIESPPRVKNPTMRTVLSHIYHAHDNFPWAQPGWRPAPAERQSTSSSTQSKVLVTAFFQLRYIRSRSASSISGSQRRSSCQLRSSSSRLSQKPTARPAA